MFEPIRRPLPWVGEHLFPSPTPPPLVETAHHPAGEKWKASFPPYPEETGCSVGGGATFLAIPPTHNPARAMRLQEKGASRRQKVLWAVLHRNHAENLLPSKVDTQDAPSRQRQPGAREPSKI